MEAWGALGCLGVTWKLGEHLEASGVHGGLWGTRKLGGHIETWRPNPMEGTMKLGGHIKACLLIGGTGSANVKTYPKCVC